jgi:hypothetical protein
MKDGKESSMEMMVLLDLLGIRDSRLGSQHRENGLKVMIEACATPRRLERAITFTHSTKGQMPPAIDPVLSAASACSILDIMHGLE